MANGESACDSLQGTEFSPDHCVQTGSRAYPVDTGYYLSGISALNIKLTTHIHLVLKLGISGAVLPPSIRLHGTVLKAHAHIQVTFVLVFCRYSMFSFFFIFISFVGGRAVSHMPGYLLRRSSS
jgi:hypothetical protein